MKKHLVILIALMLAFAAGAAPQPMGDGAGVVHITAGRILRWQENGLTRMDLSEGVGAYQGNLGITAPRMIAWFREERRNGQSYGVLELYAESGATITQNAVARREDAPALLRLTTTAGMVLRGAQPVLGDVPPPDVFRDRAERFRAEQNGAALPPELDPGFFGLLRPSAEEIVVMDMTDEGVTVMLRGNAEVTHGAATVSADTIRVHALFREPGRRSPQVQSLYAEGVVELRRGADRVTTDAVYLDMLSDAALAREARLHTDIPGRDLTVQFHAEVLRAFSRQRFAAEGPAYVTTSRFAKPHYRLQGSDVEVVTGPPAHPHRRAAEIGEEPAPEASEEELATRRAVTDSVLVSSRHNLLYFGPVPVFYWPYLAKDIRTGTFFLRSVEVGRSSNLGQFARLGWDLYDLGLFYLPNSDLTLLTDYYSERGGGVGLDFRYRAQRRFGFARAYYIHDTADEDDRGLPVPRDDRGEATLRHREELPRGWVADFELGYLSDRRFLRTYDRDAFETDKDRETQILVRRYMENSLFAIRARERINDFQNYLDRESVTYSIIGEPVANTALLWTSHTDVARLRQRFDEALGLDDPDAIGRAHTQHELSLPFQLGPVRLDPFLWGAATAYTERADDESSAARGAGGFGVRAAANAYRVYDAQSDLFGVDRLRHIVTPTLEYRNIAAVSREPRHFIQHDEIDALDETEVLRLGLRNRLQTYRMLNGVRTRVDFLTVNTDYEMNLRRNLPNTPEDDFIILSARWLPTEDIVLASEDNRYNVERGRFEAATADLALDYWRPLRVSLTQKYYVDYTEPGEPSHNVSIARLSYRPVYSRWQVDFSTAYDFTPHRNAGDTRSSRLGTGLFFTRYLEDWALTLGAEFHQGRANETVLTFNIRAPGMGESAHPYSLLGGI